MKSILIAARHCFVWVCLVVALAGIVRAFPPAPHHLFYGMVRDEYGNPLNMEGAEVVLETSANVQVNGKIIPGLNPGVNYELKTPMDAGITSDLYKPTAMMPTVPFKLKVKIGQSTYLPIEMLGDFAQIGLPGKDTRVDLTLGEDADGDGLPDAWERALIMSFGGKLGLDDINGSDDTDGDGLSNLNEYIAGTYAMDDKNGFYLGIVRMNADRPLLEFTAVRGRSYSIHGSVNLANWVPLEFSILSEGAESPVLRSYTATDVRLLQVEVRLPAGDPPRFFKLKIE